MQNIWTDPVWSKVIAAAIIAVVGFVLRLFWKKLPLIKKKKLPRRRNITLPDRTQALMLLDVNPSMLESHFDDPAAYQTMLDHLVNDELILFTESKMPVLSKKGEKLVKKQRKLEEKMRD